VYRKPKAHVKNAGGIIRDDPSREIRHYNAAPGMQYFEGLMLPMAQENSNNKVHPANDAFYCNRGVERVSSAFDNRLPCHALMSEHNFHNV
jgi:hypothetical protein